MKQSINIKFDSFNAAELREQAIMLIDGHSNAAGFMPRGKEYLDHYVSGVKDLYFRMTGEWLETEDTNV